VSVDETRERLKERQAMQDSYRRAKVPPPKQHSFPDNEDDDEDDDFNDVFEDKLDEPYEDEAKPQPLRPVGRGRKPKVKTEITVTDTSSESKGSSGINHIIADSDSLVSQPALLMSSSLMSPISTPMLSPNSFDPDNSLPQLVLTSLPSGLGQDEDDFDSDSFSMGTAGLLFGTLASASSISSGSSSSSTQSATVASTTTSSSTTISSTPARPPTPEVVLELPRVSTARFPEMLQQKIRQDAQTAVSHPNGAYVRLWNIAQSVKINRKITTLLAKNDMDKEEKVRKIAELLKKADSGN